MSAIRLYVNIDHVATVRQARRTDEPDPVRAAVLAELGGADGITVHLREDRRHIQDRDVKLLADTVRTGLNLELAASSEILDLACELRRKTEALAHELDHAGEGSAESHAKHFRDKVVPAMTALREAGDRIEQLVPHELWPLPTYREMLFTH